MYKKIISKTLYWGFPVCIISSLNEHNKTDITPISSIYCVNDSIQIGLSVISKAYENIKLHKKALFNILPHDMWNNVEKIANLTASKLNTTQIYSQQKVTVGKFKLINSNNEINMIDKALFYIDASYNTETIIDGVAHINFKVNGIYVRESLLDQEGYIEEAKFSPLMYQFRRYKKIDNEKLGESFRYVKTK